MSQFTVNQQVLTPYGVGFIAQVGEMGYKVRFRSGNSEWFSATYLSLVRVG